ncbi:MAG: peptide-binding protein [Candidatus Methylacidiphilales bacterium]
MFSLTGAGAALSQEPAPTNAPAATTTTPDAATAPKKSVSESLAPVAPEPPPKDAVTGDWLLRNMSGEPDTLNPILATDVYSDMVFGNIYESLTRQNPKTLKYEAGLAESWEVSEDKLTFTFHLRKDVKWSDGKPFTAADVKYTFDRIKDPKVDAPHLQVYYIDLVSWEALDDYTVRFKASKPYFKFFDMLGGASIIPKHIFDDGTDFNKHPANRKPIGTGPYVLEKWDTGTQFVITRRDDYWGQKLYDVFPKKIVMRVVADDNVAMQNLKSGVIDLYERILPLQWTREFNKPEYEERFHKLVYDYPQYSYFGFNLRRPLFSDVKVRKALDLLVDRKKIIDRVYMGLATAVSGPFYIKTPSYNHDVKPTQYDPEAAAKLLAEAGWKDTDGDGILDKDGKPFTFKMLTVADNVRQQRVGEIMQQDFLKAGIKMEFHKLEWAAFLKLVGERQFDAVTMAWALDTKTDPYQIWNSGEADKPNSSNNVGYKNAEVDKMMDEARLEFDDPKREAIYRKIHSIIAADVPCIFLVAPKQLSAVAKRWQNIVTFGPRPCFDVTTWYVPKDKQKYKD